MAMIRPALAVAGVLLSPLTVHAQLETPRHWSWVTDTPAELVTGQELPDSSWRFVAMPPGWHVTTGPGAFLFDPAYHAEGRFTLEAQIFLFPNPGLEGYGLFLGGRDLEPAGGSALLFLLRRDGSVAVVKRADGVSEYLVPWQVTEGVRPHPGDGVIENVIRVAAGESKITFIVNGDTAASVPREEGKAEGRFGFRIGPNLNLHLGSLDLTHHLALPRRPQ